jgi:hypothetical protein
MNDSAKTHFSLLDVQEKISKCSQLEKNKQFITVWQKGSTQKLILSVYFVDKENQRLILKGQITGWEKFSHTLGSFEINGVNYFLNSEIQFLSENELSVSLKGEFYKLERRSHFRLMAFPIYKIYFEAPISGKYQGSNVIQLSTKTSQTGIFNSFLKLVGSQKESSSLDSKIKLRVQDLSIYGMSIHIGKAELPYFKPDQILKEIQIIFTDETILIPAAKIVYVLELISHQEKRIKMFKVGIQFEGVNENLDSQLSRKITKLLREIDSNKDFEDYLK